MKNKRHKIMERVFSIRNENDKKVIQIMGMKIKVRSRMQKMKQSIRELEQKIKQNRVEMIPLQQHQEKLLKIVQLYSLPSINRDAINSEVEQMRQIGINTEEDRDTKVIISLTSYPKRMYDIHLCLYSLLTQSFKPDSVILWLAREQFPNGLDDVPLKVLNLQQWGLTIKWCDDYRSYKKLIPSLQEYPNDIIVTADDDLFYSPDWLFVLWKNYLKSNRKSLIAHRCHRVQLQKDGVQPYSQWRKCVDDCSRTFHNFPTNGGGTLFPPNSLHDDVKNYALAAKYCPYGDDIWIWGMAVRHGTKIQVVDTPHRIRYVNAAREINMNDDGTLFQSNKTGNDDQIRKLCNAYPEIRQTLIKEENEKLKVSVIVPIYNAAADLRKCLDSIVSQTLDGIEIICVNDGSTDESENILKEYAAKYSNIRIINQANQGSAAARNTGVRNAEGDYIAFVDSDDNISKNFLEALYSAAIEAHAEVAVTDQLIICHPDGARRKKDVGVLSDCKLITSIDDKGRIIIATGSTCNKLYMRNYMHRYDVYFPEVKCTGEDNYFTTFALLHAKRIAVTHDATYEYIMRSNSQTHVKKTRRDFVMIDFYKKIEKRILGLPLDDIRKRAWLRIINERKKRDYTALHRDMEDAYKDEFRKLADEHIAEVYM